MFNFLKYFTFYFIFSNIFLDIDFLENFVYNYNFFLLIFLISFFSNHYLNDFTINKNLKIDIYFKFFTLFFKLPGIFFNYIILIIKKIYLYLIFFKYKISINTCKIIYRKYFYNYFIMWKPLFKKTSYFGYYRSNRSKWIK